MSLPATVTLLLVFLWVAAVLEQPFVATQEDIKYRDRGDRFEGIRQPQVAGYDIELLSALINFQDSSDHMPPYLKVSFYLKSSSKPFLVARELDVTYHYWMDNIHDHSWQTGFANHFEWPSNEVIQKLKQIQSMYELGVVVRLNSEYPNKEETVAPAIFFHDSLPTEINGYLFTFKTNGPSRLTCQIYKEGSRVPIFTQNFPKVWGGQPFTVQWNSSSTKDGWYKLVISGSFRNNNDPIDKAVKFYHRRMVN
jgi:hypothetical protein